MPIQNFPNRKTQSYTDLQPNSQTYVGKINTEEALYTKQLPIRQTRA